MGLTMWTRASPPDASRDRDRTDGSCVSCPACSLEIPLLGKPRLPQEFSVLCPNCGQQNVYQSAATHDSKQDVETTKPRYIQFGKKAPMQSTRAV